MRYPNTCTRKPLKEQPPVKQAHAPQNPEHYPSHEWQELHKDYAYSGNCLWDKR